MVTTNLTGCKHDSYRQGAPLLHRLRHLLHRLSSEGRQARRKGLGSTMTNDSLSKAIAYLGAIEVAPGRYAIKSPTAGTWMITSADGLAAIHDAKAPVGKYQIMPAWWSPEQRIMLRCPSCRGLISRWPKEDAWKVDRCEHCDNILIEPDAGYERITADLATGEEIPA